MTEQNEKRDLPTINEGWEERFAIFSARDIDVSIALDPPVGQLLTAEESKRTEIKFRMVEDFARGLAFGMLKGSLKYKTDHWEDEKWANAAEDEEFDLVNYRLLRKSEQARRESEELQDRVASTWDSFVQQTLDVPLDFYDDPLDREQIGETLKNLGRILQHPVTQADSNLFHQIADIAQGRHRPNDLRPPKQAPEESAEPELDMREIARRNGFRLEGDRLIQMDT